MEAGVSDNNNNRNEEKKLESWPPWTAESEIRMRKSTTAPFLMKTYRMVEDPGTDDVISWNSDGTAFVVWQTAEFAKDILPKLFKHSNFSSFVRQLNTYGFRKVTTKRWEFCNEKFQKGEKKKLCEIQRRKKWSNKQQHGVDEDQRSTSSNSSSSQYNTLMDENKRLKKENGALSSELASMKNKCKELFDLVATYENISKKDEDERPKLFGVRLEGEREEEKKGRRD
ncbi:heat stress transcription factor B-3 [Cucumis melo]|uniref:Heat stress transcription factor B-3 n=1 Tax=Cucumis melo TaxID=3656 RepID=A0A1S3CD46_CUCME|nr:heat stress transcription factor B-3 [Cucumis melo]